MRVSAFTFLNFLWGWNRFQFTTNYQLYGWLTIANGGLALIFGARTNLLSQVARVPSPILLAYHRWVGTAAFVHATLHCVLTIAHFVRTKQLKFVLEAPRIPVGIMAWVALCIMAITSVPVIIRRRWFEAFYYPHFLFVVFVAGSLYHAKHGPEFLLPGLCLWAVDRAIRVYNNFRSLTVESVKHYPGGVTKFRVTGVEPSHPGQIAWVQIPSISLLNWHPFTIASAPGQNTSTIAVRALGSFTKQVQNQGNDDFEMSLMANADSSSHTNCSQDMSSPVRVRMDGPYGVGRIQWGQHPVVVLVAGGIGITPSISIASHIINQAAAGKACNAAGWHIHLLWNVKDITHLSWFEQELKGLAATASNPSLPVTLDITIHITNAARPSMETPGATEEMAGKAYKYEGPGTIYSGRADTVKWFESIRDARRGMDASVNLCGPRKMVDGARTAASRASCNDILFHVEEEVFQF